MRRGFEPLRAEPNGFQDRPFYHSGIASYCLVCDSNARGFRQMNLSHSPWTRLGQPDICSQCDLNARLPHYKCDTLTTEL